MFLYQILIKKSFEFGLAMKLNNNKTLLKNTNRFIKKIENNTQNIEQIEKDFYKIFTKKNWDNCFYPFMFFLDTIGIIKIEKNNLSQIISVYKFKNIITFHDINSFIAYQFVSKDIEETTLPYL